MLLNSLINSLVFEGFNLFIQFYPVRLGRLIIFILVHIIFPSVLVLYFFTGFLIGIVFALGDCRVRKLQYELLKTTRG